MEKITQTFTKNKQITIQAHVDAWTFQGSTNDTEKKKFRRELRHERLGVRT